MIFSVHELRRVLTGQHGPSFTAGAAFALQHVGKAMQEDINGDRFLNPAKVAELFRDIETEAKRKEAVNVP